ncbi:MAG: ABC transporter permease [Candidatus Thorarchaeota archaeon]|nr:MAG: ABC transporter permease [Candidatus Thorarchaeota archaeon]
MQHEEDWKWTSMAEVFTKPYGRIRNMVAKELRLIVKDKVALFLIFLLPAALIGMLAWVTQESSLGGVGLGGGSGEDDGFGSTDVAIGLIDLDTTRTFDGDDLSEEFTDALGNITEGLVIYENESDAFQDLYDKVILGYVVIPDGFEANLTINEPTYIEMHIDATALIEQNTVMGVVQGAVISFRAGHLWIRSEVFPLLTIEFAPEGGYLESVFGGFIIIFSSYLGIAMTAAQSIVGDIPLRRMLLTPTNRLEVIVAKALAYLMIGFFQSLLLISLWVIAFDLSLNTGFEMLIFIMSLTSLTGSATGILISAVASTRLQANQMFLFVLFATLIMAGFFIDVGILDEILPMNQGLQVLIDTAFKGLTLVDVLEPVMKLVGFSALAILGATFIFSKKPTLG